MTHGPRYDFQLGPHATAVDTAYERLARQRANDRLWAGESSLWSSDPSTQAAIRQRLGWRTIPSVMRAHAPRLRDLANTARQAGRRRILLLGMGGSGLFADVCRSILGVADDGLDLAVLDTTDPAAIRAAERQGPLEELLLLVSSKSGSTAEVNALSRYFVDRLRQANRPVADHCIVITDEGTSLVSQAAAWGCREVFTHGPGTGAEVGGRFSALTFFGLVPAALLGADVDRLLERGQQSFDRCRGSLAAFDEPSVRLGATLAALAETGCDKLTLLCPPALESFGTWAEQLVAESLGKSGRGIVPVHQEPWLAPSAYGRDRVFVALRLDHEPQAALDRQIEALRQAGHPVVTVAWADRYDLGSDVATWSVAVALAGTLLEINPFDEPNVAESKARTQALLATYAKTSWLPDDPSAVSDASSFTEALQTLNRQQRPGDYAAVLSFLPRTPVLDAAVQEVRSRWAARLQCASVVGFGPRYLHSTGQLFKGGPDRGLFLVLTADDAADLPIPGEPCTFGVLKRAQALGDVEAMRQRGRRLLHLHLGRDPERAMRQLRAAVEA